MCHNSALELCGQSEAAAAFLGEVCMGCRIRDHILRWGMKISIKFSLRKTKERVLVSDISQFVAATSTVMPAFHCGERVLAADACFVVPVREPADPTPRSDSFQFDTSSLTFRTMLALATQGC